MKHLVQVWARCSGKYAFAIYNEEERIVEESRYVYGSYAAAEKAGLKRADHWDFRTNEACGSMSST